MDTKLYVGNLAYSTDDEGLRAYFSQFGQVVEATVIKDRDSGRSKGFGFVTFATEAEAQAAKNGAEGQELDGRALHVDIARPKTTR